MTRSDYCSQRNALNAPYNAELELVLGEDPVLRSLRDYMSHLGCCATASQVARQRHELSAMFVMMTAEASWRIDGVIPAVWEYLAHRQINSFLPFLALIDVIADYELDANIYSSAQVRKATTLAASASIVANDLYSVAKDALSQMVDFNLCGLLASKHECSVQESIRMGVAIHDELMQAYEIQEHQLLTDACPQLERYLAGIRAWVAGSREWHCKSARYCVDA
jgi:2-methylisoborneol synthase